MKVQKSRRAIWRPCLTRCRYFPDSDDNLSSLRRSSDGICSRRKNCLDGSQGRLYSVTATVDGKPISLAPTGNRRIIRVSPGSGLRLTIMRKQDEVSGLRRSSRNPPARTYEGKCTNRASTRMVEG